MAETIILVLLIGAGNILRGYFDTVESLSVKPPEPAKDDADDAAILAFMFC